MSAPVIGSTAGEDAYPRTLSSRLSLLEARERLAEGVAAPVVRPRASRRLWVLWGLLLVPVVVAAAWRWL